ncbi:RHS repeat-associated core domain-containing protein [Actinoallomurus oryzae]|uniref:RHS repeat-associated core domain-containing protein n=1 Tax=Actinoallomurus oryzae TaxID=502180 RepID=UPI0031E6495E
MAGGEVVLRQVDVELAGALPLVLERTYLSSSLVNGFFGMSWASTLDQRLEIDAEGVCFASADGMVLAYATPVTGARVLPESGPRWPLRKTIDGTYTITDPRAGREWRFEGRSGTALPLEGPSSAVLPLTSIVDRNGHRIDLVYDDDALSEIRHSGGYRIAVAMDGDRVAALRLVTGEAGGQVLVRYRYDDTGRLSEVINSSGVPLRFTYDGVGRLTGWVDRNGFWYRYVYDDKGRAVRAEGSDGMLNVSLSYAEDGSATTVTDSLGHRTTFHFNASRQVVAQVDPLGRRTVSKWDAQDRLLARTDPLGRTTRYAYDGRGNLTSITGPGERRLSARYNELGLPVEFVEADGAVWRQEFDSRGNVIAITDPRDAVTRCSYDERGHLTAIRDALGLTTRVALDDAGLPVATTKPGGATTRMDRDAFGRVTAIRDAAGGVTRFGWTIEGRPAWRTLPGGATERWRYDAEGNCVEYQDPAGHITRTVYGPFDKPVARIGPDGARTEFSYDTELRLIAVTNPVGLVWRYQYNASGDLVRETDFDGRTVSYAHDAGGRHTTRVNGAGQVTHYTYDLFDNVVEQRSGDTVATFTYDPAGRLIRAVNPDADVRFDRDPLGRIIRETCNGRTLTSVYDPMGRRIRRRTPSGTETTWRYDGDGPPAALETAGQTIRFIYDPAGREVERRIGGGAVLTRKWNADRRLSSQTLWNAGADRPSQHRAYRYRTDGALVGMTDQFGGPTSFDLDLAGRVTDVHAGDRRERYAYDPAGNITEAGTGADHGTAGPREHAGVRVRRAGRTHYSHDEQGRVVARRQVTPSGKSLTWEYTWDADDRLRALTTPDGRRWRYRYDALGRRVAKQLLTRDGQAVEDQADFVWDGPVLTEQVQSGRVTTWDYEPDTFRPLTQTEGVAADDGRRRIDQRFYAIVTDLIGTPTEFITADGTVSGWLRTTLWGAPLAGPGTVDCPLRFPGQYHDRETGLHYNFQRYYDPAAGRYQSPDPLGLAPAPDPYGYTVNPTVQIDPLGLAPCAPGPHLALGLKYSLGGGRPLLEPFAQQIGAHTFFDMPRDWLHGSNQETILHLLKHPDTKLSFNMTGVDNPYEAFLRVAKNRGNIGSGAGFTDWELYQISMHPETWSKITFYKDGKVIGNPFEMNVGQLAHPIV